MLEETEGEGATSLRSDISEADLRAEVEDGKRVAGGRGWGNSMPGSMGAKQARKSFENMSKIKRTTKL